MTRRRTSGRTPGELTRRFAFWTAAAALGSTACGRQNDAERTAEVARVARAVEALRAAPNDGKRPLLKALEAVTCESGDARALKDACVKAYGVELSALDALRAVRAETRKADSLHEGAVEVLAGAERDLAASRELAVRCADLEAGARRKYGF